MIQIKITVYLLFVLILPTSSFANPINPTVVGGAANIAGLGTPEVTIQQNTPQAILHWDQFNIAAGEVTRFLQPSAQAIALNRIFDANPSRIFGALQANGSVILLNPNGVLFGPGAQVDVNGLIASSLNLTNDDFLQGLYRFEGSTLAGPVRNEGTLQTGPKGYIYLFSPKVENRGIIRSPEGHISLAAGTSVYLSDHPDGRGFLVEVKAPEGSTTNLQDLIADGGRIDLFGKVVNVNGLVRANSVAQKEGRITFLASERVTIGSESRIEAKGDVNGISKGGTIIALSDKTSGETQVESGAVLDISGGREGGNGGLVELSGAAVLLEGNIQGRATSGYRGGKLLIDPVNLQADDAFFQNLSLQTGLSEIEVQADQDIDVGNADGSPLVIFLSNWGAPEGGEQALRFTAGNNLRLTETWFINDPETDGVEGSRWNITATAGNDILLTAGKLWLGKGGNIDLSAGRDIRLLNGTTPSYLWVWTGGNIHLVAGQDIVAPSAMDTTYGNLYSGIRLNGGMNNLPGELTINAERDFIGTTMGIQNIGPGFVLSNGFAMVTIGGNMGSTANYANLTFGSGEIDMTVGGNIYLGLVQDQGIAEGFEATADPGNSVHLMSFAGDIHLKPAASVTARDGDQGQVRQYYPASFQAGAPAGNIFIESLMTFWPSLTGSLDFFARDNIQGTLINGIPGSINLFPFIPEAPAALTGMSVSEILGIRNTPARNVPAHDPAPVRFRTETGDIRTINLNLYSPTILKEVTIESGRDLKEFIAGISVPEGVQGVVSAEGNIDMTRPSTGTALDSGINFYGNGNALIRVGGNLDLANSQGITQRHSRYPSSDVNTGGLLEIAVGENLEMTESRIVTENGAAIDIHGLNGPENPVGGKVNVGTNDTTGFDTFGNYLGIITLRGGSIDIDATGNVDVNKSRIATFGGGDITIDSVQGNINAGSGGKGERVEFVIEQEVKDEEGNVLGRSFFRAEVPGSGIFTFHPDDPNPLPDYPPPPQPDLPEWTDYEPQLSELPEFQEPALPPAPAPPVIPPAPQEPVVPPLPQEPVWPAPPGKTPEMVRLEDEIVKQRFLGHDTFSLEAALTTAYETQGKEYQALVNRMYDDYVASFGDYKTQVEQLYADYQLQVQDYRDQVNEMKATYEAAIEGYKEEVEAIFEAAAEQYKEDVVVPIYEAAVAEYNAKVREAVQDAAVLYEQIKAEHSKDWKLGNIDLTAEAGDIIVPPAGIRGKTVTLTAKNLVLEGGEIQGNVQFDIDQIIGNLGDIAGPIGGTVGGDIVVSIDIPEITIPEIPQVALPEIPELTLPEIPKIDIPLTPTVTIPTTPAISVPTVSTVPSGGTSSLGGLSGSMGSLSSSVSVSAATTVAVASVQEEVVQQAKTETAAGETVSGDDGSQKDKKRKGLRLKRGVTIEVEIQEN